LKGLYQKKNLKTVLMALSIIEQKGIHIGASSIVRGLGCVVNLTGLLGRWQEISYNPLVVCDTAHNYNGIENILEQIKNTPYRKLHMVLGFVADKDIRSIASILPQEANYYLCEPNVPRAKKVDELKTIFDEFNLNNESYSKVAEAYQSAAKQANEADLLYIGGSTFVVADFLEWQKENL
jgi:dihydrofolate synthase/folylpolyglutamate synthase